MGKSTSEWVWGMGVGVLALAQGGWAQDIAIANADSLYAAVNDPANTGATLVLAPGTYLLSASDQSGQPRPNGGRIELQHDMSLQGVVGDRHAVVIDAHDLPASSFVSAIPGPTAAIRMGLGHNSLEWLSVRDAQNAQANIDSGLQPLDPDTAHIRVAHVDSSGSTRGLNVLNFGAATSYQTIEADIVDCDFHDNTLNLSEGVRTGNFQGAYGATVNVRMTGNRSWGQKQGRLIVNNRANASVVNVVSSGNQFFGNGGGTIIVGGLSSNNTRADGNRIRFEAHGDRFLDNTAESEFDHGGLVALGTEDITASPTLGGGSHNAVEIMLWGTRMSGNDHADLAAFGARSLSLATAGKSVGNSVTIEIHGDGGSKGKWQRVEEFADAAPAGPANGNSVTVVRN